MKCHLCLQDKDLLKKSHIIPNFMYRNLFDENHRMVRTQGLDISSARKIQSGEHEGHILCQQCDNEILGSMEGYAHKVLFTPLGNGPDDIRTQNVLHPDGKLTSTLCENLDYAKFKLFLLSLLWRASISQLDFFKIVQLGPKKEESIRKMIFDNDPLSQLDFPCMVSSFRGLQRNMTSGVISSPRRVRNEKGTRYVFQIGQLVLVFFVSESDTPEWLQDAAITTENKMRILHFSNEMGRDLMETYFGPVMTQALYLAKTGKKGD